MQAINNVMYIRHRNPGADADLICPVIVLPNTPEEAADAQIARNAALPLTWLKESEPHEGIAILCGGGPSLTEHMPEIAEWRERGATVFGLNAAAIWLHKAGVPVDWQVIVDAKEETASLVEPMARAHLFSSQVHPSTVDSVPEPVIFHLANVGIEDLLPEERREAGEYTLIGGGVSVGITSLCVAWAMGYREIHCYGYDSSNRGEATHAYEQPMNAHLPQITVTWGGRPYRASMPMKIQAEAFLPFARELVSRGVKLEVHGDGLLPAMWKERPATEREKYQKLWIYDEYRRWSPGVDAVDHFLEVVKPDGTIIDFGCGTGLAGKAIHEKTGLGVILVDFTDNSRDVSVGRFVFRQHDLTEPLEVRAPYGFCTDVMEHIPPKDVNRVIRNIMDAAPRTYFQIATYRDGFGDVIGEDLHLTVEPLAWWKRTFFALGYRIAHAEENERNAILYIVNGNGKP